MPSLCLQPAVQRSARSRRRPCRPHSASTSLNPPCGRQDQRKHAEGVLGQLLKDGQRKRRRLAAAGVRHADDVAAGQHGRDGPALHLRGRGHAQPGAHSVQPLRQAQLAEAAGAVGVHRGGLGAVIAGSAACTAPYTDGEDKSDRCSVICCIKRCTTPGRSARQSQREEQGGQAVPPPLPPPPLENCVHIVRLLMIITTSSIMLGTY